MVEGYISEPDSARFGIKVARINSFDGPVRDIVERCEQWGVRLIISRVPVDDVRLINEMEDSGFRVRDIQATYSIKLEQKPAAAEYKGMRLDLGMEEIDPDILAGISRESFEGYGHYSRGRITGKTGTGEIYADWTRKCCGNENLADQLVVARVKNQVAGFLFFKVKKEGGDKFLAGVMGAVDKRFRGRGVFKAINLSGLKWAWDNKLTRVEHNVLVTNTAVNKVYADLGFSIVRCEVTMHRELRPQ